MCFRKLQWDSTNKTNLFHHSIKKVSSSVVNKPDEMCFYIIYGLLNLGYFEILYFTSMYYQDVFKRLV